MPKEYRNVTRNTDGTFAGEWRLVGWDRWMSFSEAKEELLFLEVALDKGPAAVAAVWARQDGYGEPGYTPSQGFDWSGIRDSSESAMARMVAAASKFLSFDEFWTALGVT